MQPEAATTVEEKSASDTVVVDESVVEKPEDPSVANGGTFHFICLFCQVLNLIF